MLASLLAVGLDPKRSIIFHQDHVGHQRCIHCRSQSFPPEPEPHRTCLDPQLSMSDRETEKDDHMEGTFVSLCVCLRFDISPQARLAASRNANNESEVDESLLNAGLFTYPVLQAADILAYRCAFKSETASPILRVIQGNACPRRRGSTTTPGAFARPRGCFQPSIP
jgi:tryptophanyl-tRNA synthetase